MNLIKSIKQRNINKNARQAASENSRHAEVMTAYNRALKKMKSDPSCCNQIQAILQQTNAGRLNRANFTSYTGHRMAVEDFLAGDASFFSEDQIKVLLQENPALVSK